MPTVQVEGLGNVQFPDGMAPEEMTQHIQNALAEKNTGKPMTGQPNGGNGLPDPITGNTELTNKANLWEGLKGAIKGEVGGAQGLGDLITPKGSFFDTGHVMNTESSNPQQTAGKVADFGVNMALPAIQGAEAGVKALSRFALPDVEEAAMKGLRVPAGSKNANKVLGNVEMAKPYLQGANSLEELQGKIPGAKAEVYQPYEDFINANRHASAGDSTIGNLYDRDKEITAQLGQIKSDPLAMQQAAQKGLNQADLIAEQKAIRARLFPAAEQSGVDATGINKTYGALKGIEKQVAGKNTVLVPDEPMGFGRLRNLKFDQPVKALEEIKPAAKDILNGRFWSGNPVDIGIEDAFKTAGPKPNLGKYTPPARLALPSVTSETVPEATDLAAPHGEVFPRVTASRLKRADLY